MEYTWKDMGLRIDNATGVLTDISSYVNSQALQSAITDLDKTGMGAASKRRQNGLADISLPLNGFLNSTTEPILGSIVNGTSVTKTVEFKAATGKYYNGEFLPTNIQFSGSPDTLELFSLTLANHGAVNRTSVALA